MKTGRLIALLPFLLLVGCGGSGSDGQPSGEQPDATFGSGADDTPEPASNTAPVAGDVAVFGCETGAVCSYSFFDAEGGSDASTVAWFLDGERVDGESDAILDASFLEGKSSILCSVAPSDGYLTGTPVASTQRDLSDLAGDPALSCDAYSIGDPPEIVPPTVASIELTTPVCADATCVYSYDPGDEGGSDQSILHWTVNGTEVLSGVGETILPMSEYSEGDTVACSVEASDGTRNGTTASAESTATLSAPTVSASTRGSGRVGEELTCVYGASDECEEVTIEVVWEIDGAETPGGDIFDTTGLAHGDSVGCKVTATTNDTAREATVTATPTILTGDTWSIVGAEEGATISSVDVVADIDGDGFGEIVFGSPGADVDGMTGAGRVYVVHGSARADHSLVADLLAGDDAFTIAGASGSHDLSRVCHDSDMGSEADFCGTATVAGFDWDVADPSGGRHEFAFSEGFNLGSEGDSFGWRVSAAGDTNGDEVPDFLVGAPFAWADPGGSGTVETLRPWSGRAYLLSGATARYADTSAMASLHGFSLAGECGSMTEIYDGNDFPDRIAGLPEYMTNGDLAGWGITALGDVNGDGLDDMAFAAPNAGIDDDGLTYVIYGAEEGASLEASEMYAMGCDTDADGVVGDTSRGFVIRGYSTNFDGAGGRTKFGWGALTHPGGDFDGDGYADVLAQRGSRFEDTAMTFDLAEDGTDYVLYLGGHERSLVTAPVPDEASIVFESSDDLWGFDCFSYGGGRPCENMEGFAWAGGGDFNGDYRDDIIAPMFIIAASDIRSGAILLGQTNTDSISVEDALGDTTGTIAIPILETGSVSSSQVDSLGLFSTAEMIDDINGDGFDEAAFSLIRYSDSSGKHQGDVFVIFGGDDITEVDLADIMEGNGGLHFKGGAWDRMGIDLASGDVDGDGLSDLLIASSSYSEDTTYESESDPRLVPQEGKVDVIFGRDFTGDIDLYGSAEADELIGSAEADSIVAGRGDDVIRGEGGEDVIYAGAGDDTIHLGDSAFRRVDGGYGFDTVVLEEGVGFAQLDELRYHFREIEALELNGQNFTIKQIDILNLSATHNRLFIRGTGEVNTEAGDYWTDAEAQEYEGEEYWVISQGRAEVWIALSVGTNIRPALADWFPEIPEDIGADESVGIVPASDADGLIRTFTIVDQANAGDFYVDAQGEVFVSASASLDYEDLGAEHWIEVEVEDNRGNTNSRRYEISVTDVNEPPFFQPSSDEKTIEEGTVGAIAPYAALDPDAGDDGFVYTLIDPSGHFSVDASSGMLSVSGGLDRDVAEEHLLELIATDSGGLSGSLAITIAVADWEVLETSVVAYFTLTDQSLMADVGASEYDYDESAYSVYECLDLDADLPTGSVDLTFSDLDLGLTDLSGKDLGDLIGELTGEICGDVSFDVSPGGYSVAIPTFVEFDWPEMASSGVPFVLNSSLTLLDDPVLVGQTTSFDYHYYTHITDMGADMSYCAPLSEEDLVLGTCSLIELPSSVRHTDSVGDAGFMNSELFQATYEESGVDEFRLSFSPDPASTYVPVGTSGIGDLFDGDQTYLVGDFAFTYNWTPYADEWAVSGYTETSGYLQVSGFEATITFEDGSTQVFDLNDSPIVTVDAAMDLDANGSVAIEVEIEPIAELFATYELDLGVTYDMSWYSWKAEVEYDSDTIAEESFGPLIEQQFMSNEQLPNASHDIQYIPTRWATTIIRGEIELAP